ncbi:hypothetical protein BDW60DRAFT_191380 [Aspergillus nidulans var. acristatus]
MAPARYIGLCSQLNDPPILVFVAWVLFLEALRVSRRLRRIPLEYQERVPRSAPGSTPASKPNEGSLYIICNIPELQTSNRALL